MNRFLVIFSMMLYGLFLYVGCSGPKFHLISSDELTQTDNISLTLAVSDSVFSLSAVKAYREEFDPFKWPLVLNYDSAGPQLYLWFHNGGQDGMFPINYYPLGFQEIRVAGSSFPYPLEIVFSVDGEEYNYDSAYSKNLGLVSMRQPCDIYPRVLQYVKEGESVPLPYPIYLFWELPLSTLKPGLYEVGVILQSICEGETDKPLWRGKIASNRVRFRIVDR